MKQPILGTDPGGADIAIDIELRREKGMPEETSLTIHPSPDLTNAGFTATEVSQVPHMQAGLLEWARLKLERSRSESAELEESCRIAALNGFNRNAFKRAAETSVKMVAYYEKLIAALEAGYCVFPTTDVTVFAVRTARKKPDENRQIGNKWSGRDEARRDIPAQALAAGEGKYVDDQPTVWFVHVPAEEKQSDGTVKTVVRKEYFSKGFADEIGFPFELGKPEILKVTSRAMALKVFDELGVLPPYESGRNADPVVVGRIIHPKSKKRVSFMLAWFVDTREL